jgi:hypothetical protein
VAKLQALSIHFPADTEANYQTSHMLIKTESSEPSIISRRSLKLLHALNTGRRILFALMIHSTDIRILILLPRMTYLLCLLDCQTTCARRRKVKTWGYTCIMLQ